jgi:ActR/RegA family two-component response regulator
MIVNRDSSSRRRARRPARAKPRKKRPAPRANSAKFERALERLCLSQGEVELANVVEEHIRKVLWAAQGEVSLAAQLLGLHRRSLQRMIQRRQKKPKP